MNKFKKKLKIKHILPVYRCDIIEHAKELSNGVVEYSGICFLLCQSLFDFHYYYDSVYDIKEVFPLLTLENARIHGGDCSPYASEKGFWWERDCWFGGRKRFFQWLYEQYKDDKIKIR